MTKPHEEEWSTGDGVLSGALYSGDTWIGSFTNPERARLAVHAPKMARALLMVLNAAPWGEYSDEVQAIRNALNAAGVDIP